MAKQTIKITEDQLNRVINEAINNYITESCGTPEMDEGFLTKRIGQMAKNAKSKLADAAKKGYEKVQKGVEQVRDDYKNYQEMNAQAKEDQKSVKAYSKLVDEIEKIVAKYDGYISNRQTQKINSLLKSLKLAKNAMMGNAEAKRAEANRFAVGTAE